MRYFDRDAVFHQLNYDICIPAVAKAMQLLSRGGAKHLPRAVLTLSEGRLLGLMEGALGTSAAFGAKVISVFHSNFEKGLPSHQGVVLVFDPESGALACLADAGAITAIRTAAASAIATDALARRDARRLAILGYGEQARTHAHAIARVRELEAITIWGRSAERAGHCAARLSTELGIPALAATSVEAAVADADIVCTVTAAREPILMGRSIGAGVHVNVVGSSVAGPVEIDIALVANSRFYVDCRENVLAAGAEFLRAKAAGAVDDAHIVGEIGEVLNGDTPGRRDDREITVYKSLGHIVQDLAAAQALIRIEKA